MSAYRFSNIRAAVSFRSHLLQNLFQFQMTPSFCTQCAICVRSKNSFFQAVGYPKFENFPLGPNIVGLLVGLETMCERMSNASKVFWEGSYPCISSLYFHTITVVIYHLIELFLSQSRRLEQLLSCIHSMYNCSIF